ncbi:MAG: helix-turn-helix transcriptional regulator [Clostridia bacterium]|nr:helix-turn-helix transcriptional regulator [Clostridia bacterium]
MQLYIGENIKRLRRQKGITQETLAERMFVSVAAVSKWERNESLPDIGMVLPLASYFGVSTDELLGLDAAKTEEKIREILCERNRLCALGKEQEVFDLIVRAYQDFPNDWRIVEEYMWKLNYDPNCAGPYGSEVHKEELYQLCERVLDECTVDQVRYSAISILGGLYVLDGQIDKAIETAKRFPSLRFSQEQELQGCWEKGTAEWWKYTRSGLAEFAECLTVDVRDMALEVSDPHESIRILKKAIALIELLIDDGDYCFWHYHLAELHILIAHRHVRACNIDVALTHFEKGLEHAKAYDDLPQTTAHTSFLVRGNVFDVRNINSGTEKNDVARELGYILESDSYRKLKDDPKMQAIIAKYEPFVGNKKAF